MCFGEDPPLRRALTGRRNRGAVLSCAHRAHDAYSSSSSCSWS
jgi:hypothetical protein